MKYLKEFSRYVFLSIFSMVGLSLYIIVDTIFIEQKLGTNGLTALNLALPIFNIEAGLSLMIGLGGATLFNINYNKNNQEKANQAFTHSLIYWGILSVIMVVIGATCSDLITKAFHASSEVYDSTYIYLKMTFILSPIMMLDNIMMTFLRNDKKPQLATICLMTSSMMNIFLDWLLMYPIEWGIFGAVLATGISPLFSLMISGTYLLRKKNNFHLTTPKFSFKLTRDILFLGAPNLLTELSTATITIVFNSLLLKLTNDNTSVAAFGVILNINLVVVAVFNGIAQGIQPLISKHYAKKNYSGIKYNYIFAVILSSVLSVIFYIAIYFGTNGFISIFNSAHNAELVKIADTGLKLFYINTIFAGFNIITALVFSAMKKPYQAQAVSLLRGFIIIVPMAYLLAYTIGINGVWLSSPVTEIIVTLIAIILVIFVFRTIKKNFVYTSDTRLQCPDNESKIK